MKRFCIKHKKRFSQAMTEVVLLIPIFMIVTFFIAKIFALLILIQKMEIAAYYTGRRWQLESHMNVRYMNDDHTVLLESIRKVVADYLGYNSRVRGFLGLSGTGPDIEITRTQVWNVVTIRVQTTSSGIRLLCKYPEGSVCTGPFNNKYCFSGYDFMCRHGRVLEIVKYVSNRDRPIAFVLPGLQE